MGSNPTPGATRSGRRGLSNLKLLTAEELAVKPTNYTLSLIYFRKILKKVLGQPHSGLILRIRLYIGQVVDGGAAVVVVVSSSVGP